MVGGSAALVELARSVSMMARMNPAEPEENRFLFEIVKLSNGQPGARHVYEIERATVINRDGVVIETSRTNVLDEPASKTIYEVVSGGGVEDKSAVEDAKDFLSRLLGDGRPMEAKLIYKEAKAAGHSVDTIKRAKKDLKVSSEKKGFGNGTPWCWRMEDIRTDEERDADASARRTSETPPSDKVVVAGDQRSKAVAAARRALTRSS